MTEIEDRIKRLSEPFDQAVIQYKPKGGRQMAFISHGLVTKRLNERAPGWSSRIVGTAVDATPNPKGGLLYTADATLELTVAGVTRAEVGTNNQPVADRGQALKSAASDALKRAAMRFGVALDLWESLDEQDEDAQHVATTPRAGTTPGREPAPRSAAAAPGPTHDRPAAVPSAAGPPSSGNGKRPPTVAEALTAARNETLSAKARQYAAVRGLGACPTLDEAADYYLKVLPLAPEREALEAAYKARNEALRVEAGLPF